MRLVGMPGETIQIDNGQLFIDGELATLPSELADLKYEPIPDFDREWWGSKEKPAVLGDKEYFVLGDFSPASLDSRYPTLDDNISRFAVPAENIIGVVINIYWPFERWRAFR